MGLGELLLGNLGDVRTFGVGVLTRHLGWFSKDRVRTSHLKGVGRVAMRVRDSDMECVRQVFRFREYSFTHLPAVEARLRAKYDGLLAAGVRPAIVDAGANIGAASLWFAWQYPEARIAAIEPDAGNFDLLGRNTRHLPNVTPLLAALDAEPGFVEVLGSDAGWTVRTRRAEAGLEVVTVEDAIRACGGGEPFIVKIDIEGFERDLFRSNLQWIDRTYAVIIEPHDWMLPGRFTSAPFMRALSGGDFEVFVIGENLAFVRE